MPHAAAEVRTVRISATLSWNGQKAQMAAHLLRYGYVDRFGLQRFLVTYEPRLASVRNGWKADMPKWFWCGTIISAGPTRSCAHRRSDLPPRELQLRSLPL